MAVGGRVAALLPPYRLTTLPSLLVPMDESQSDHLKAYGVAYRAIQAGLKAEWLLNYRGGSFLLPDGPALRREAALAGVGGEAGGDARGAAIPGGVESGDAHAVPPAEA